MLTQKDQQEAEIMKQCGVFDFSGGVAFVYRDPQGVLKAIKIELNTFRNGKIKMSEDQLGWMISIKNQTA
jgi:hypothetical protein